MSEVLIPGEMSFADAVAAAMGTAAPAPSEAPSAAAPEATPAPAAAPSEPSQPAPTQAPAEAAAPVANDPFKAELEAIKAELAALKAAPKAPEPQRAPEPPVAQEFELDFDSHASVDPVGAIAKLAKKFNMDPKALASDLWYESLGDKAPPEYLAKREGKAGQLAAKLLERRTQEERKRAEEQSQRTAGVRAEQSYVNGLFQYVSDDAVASKYENTNRLAKAIPDMVAGGFWNTAVRLNKEHGRPPRPEEVAAELEKELQNLARVLAPQQAAAPAAPAPTAPVAAVAPKAPEVPDSLRNQHTQVQPSRQPADELDDDFLRRKAMEALNEFRAAQRV